MVRTAPVVFLAAFLMSSAASAAMVEFVEGHLSLNQGNGYKPVANIASANSGDLVMASPGGSGKIVYADGCVVEVKPGTWSRFASNRPVRPATHLGSAISC